MNSLARQRGSVLYVIFGVMALIIGFALYSISQRPMAPSHRLGLSLNKKIPNICSGIHKHVS